MPLPRNWFLLLRQYQSPCRIHALWKEWHECWTALIMLSIFSFLSFFGGRQFDIIEWLETWESERWESCFCHYQLCDLRKTSLSFISSRVKCRKIYFVHKTVWGLHFKIPMQFLAQCFSCKFNSPVIILVYIGQLINLLMPITLHLLEITLLPALFHTLSVMSDSIKCYDLYRPWNRFLFPSGRENSLYLQLSQPKSCQVESQMEHRQVKETVPKVFIFPRSQIEQCLFVFPLEILEFAQ